VKDFAFEYKMHGETFGFTVPAETEKEARRKLIAMQSARCIGECYKVGEPA
jgi:hypothetical protein